MEWTRGKKICAAVVAILLLCILIAVLISFSLFNFVEKGECFQCPDQDCNKCPLTKKIETKILKDIEEAFSEIGNPTITKLSELILSCETNNKTHWAFLTPDNSTRLPGHACGLPYPGNFPTVLFTYFLYSPV